MTLERVPQYKKSLANSFRCCWFDRPTVKVDKCAIIITSIISLSFNTALEIFMAKKIDFLGKGWLLQFNDKWIKGGS